MIVVSRAERSSKTNQPLIRTSRPLCNGRQLPSGIDPAVVLVDEYFCRDTAIGATRTARAVRRGVVPFARTPRPRSRPDLIVAVRAVIFVGPYTGRGVSCGA